MNLLLSRSDDYLSNSTSIHMIFHFNQQSELLMLKRESYKVSVKYRLNDKWVKLKYDEEHFIYEFSTRIQANMCKYKLKHMIKKKYRALYFYKRNRFLTAQLWESFEFKIKSLQRMLNNNYVLRKQYLELKTREFDAFDWITQKLDIKTDNSMIIKELQIKVRNKFKIMIKMNMKTHFIVCINWILYIMFLIHFRMSLIYFQLWARYVSMIILKSAVTWKDSFSLCWAQSQISRKNFKKIQVFHNQRSCNCLENFSKISRHYMSWESCIATSDQKTCSLYLMILLALRFATTTKSSKQRHSKSRQPTQSSC